MPHRVWRHSCGGRATLIPAPECIICGGSGESDGWRLSMWEQAARYHYVYGLNPFGRHRSLADRLIRRRRATCTRCAGHGILDVSDGMGWCYCPVCEGTGSIWNCAQEEVDAIVNLIVRL